jgi:hypothetical protein
LIAAAFISDIDSAAELMSNVIEKSEQRQVLMDTYSWEEAQIERSRPDLFRFELPYEKRNLLVDGFLSASIAEIDQLLTPIDTLKLDRVRAVGRQSCLALVDELASLPTA